MLFINLSQNAAKKQNQINKMAVHETSILSISQKSNSFLYSTLNNSREALVCASNACTSSECNLCVSVCVCVCVWMFPMKFWLCCPNEKLNTCAIDNSAEFNCSSCSVATWFYAINWNILHWYCAAQHRRSPSKVTFRTLFLADMINEWYQYQINIDTL